MEVPFLVHAEQSPEAIWFLDLMTAYYVPILWSWDDVLVEICESETKRIAWATVKDMALN